jgi:hypothetical protein
VVIEEDAREDVLDVTNDVEKIIRKVFTPKLIGKTERCEDRA